MELQSSGFRNGTTIPRRFTCDGEDVSPPFEWSGTPAATRSFVLLCDDPDAPAGTWHHWAAYDIPADQTGLTEGAARGAAGKSFKQAINDFRKPGYGGPCPPTSMESTTITFVCWLCLSTSYRSALSRPAKTSSERRASTLSPKQPSWVFTSDDCIFDELFWISPVSAFS